MAIPQGVNSLIGSFDAQQAVGGSRGFGQSDPQESVMDSQMRESPRFGNQGFLGSMMANRSNAVTDGSEWIVGAIVIIALLLLISFRVGGFQAIIATR